MAMEDKVLFCPKCWKDTYFIKPGQKPKYDTCEYCGAKLLYTDMTAEERFLIQHISKDHDFMMAMIDLKKNDIIEYQTKIAQYKQMAKADGCYTSPAEKNKPKCPNCHSTNIKPISGLNRGASIAMWGIFSKKINKSFECKNCGYTW